MNETRPLRALRSERFHEALVFAAAAHEDQRRKGTEIPYIAHLLTVTAIVVETGGDEDQAIAALLHDAIEDQGGDVMRRRIRARFGDRVTMMVDDCTEVDIVPKPPWKERKLAYIAHIPEAHADSLLVSMADKLHNARSILRDLRRRGPAAFERFNAGPEDTLWYYASLVQAFAARAPQGRAANLLDRLEKVVRALRRELDARSEAQPG